MSTTSGPERVRVSGSAPDEGRGGLVIRHGGGRGKGERGEEGMGEETWAATLDWISSCTSGCSSVGWTGRVDVGRGTLLICRRTAMTNSPR